MLKIIQWLIGLSWIRWPSCQTLWNYACCVNFYIYIYDLYLCLISMFSETRNSSLTTITTTFPACPRWAGMRKHLDTFSSTIISVSHSFHDLSAPFTVECRPMYLPYLSSKFSYSPHHVAQHRPTGSETTPPYAPRSSRFGSEPPSVEDDVDVWRYAILGVGCQKRRRRLNYFLRCSLWSVCMGVAPFHHRIHAFANI